MAAKASDKEIKMEYTRLGKSGLNISKLILGGMSYGSSDWWEWVLNEEAALPLLKHAFDAGITTWDTADMYSNGVSEKIIGNALKKYNIPRNRVVILTKCYFGVTDPEEGQQRVYATPGGDIDPKWVNRIGLSRKHIFDAVDASVERLGTYIDVLQIHRLDHETPREEIMKALNDVVESGKVRYIGASSVSHPYLSEARPDPLTPSRWRHGSSRLCRTSPKRTAGTSSSACRTTTTSSTARRSAR